MLNCFDNLITLAPTGSLSLATIGITERLLGSITNEEETPESLLENCETLARAVIANDVVTHFGDKIIPKTFVDRAGFGIPDEDADVLTPAAGTIGGYVVEIDQPRSNAVLRIGMLGAWMTSTGPQTITIYDLADGSTIATHVLDCTAGVILREDVQIEIPAYRARRRLFITTNAATYHKVDVAPGDCLQCGKRGWHYQGVTVKGGILPAAAAKLWPNVQTVSHTSGLLMTITLECDHAAMLCEVKKTLALPYLYKVGHIMIDRAIHAFDRLNSETIPKDALMKRADRLGAEYVEAMKNALSKMQPPQDPMCFICHERTRSVVILP
jgi:hypothetical protein